MRQDVSRHFTIPPELSGERLDRVIVALAPELSRSGAQRLLKDGNIRLDGTAAKASDKPRAGQTLTVSSPSPRPLELTPEDFPLDVVYEDDDLLVVNKPPQMVVHPAKGHQNGTLVNALLAHCQLSTSGEEIRPGIVHRLDQHTSGLLLVAKHDQAHAALSRQVEAHEVRRVYHALVWGKPPTTEGRLVTAFGRHPHHRTLMAVLEAGRGREAITRYRLLEPYEWSWQPCRAGACTPPPSSGSPWAKEDGGVQAPALQKSRPRKREASLVECVLETGRTHQIRVHLAHLGCPLAGDPVYGDAVRDHAGPPELDALVAQLPGQALHAARLTFRHPLGGREITVEAAPPEAFSALLQWLRRA